MNAVMFLSVVKLTLIFIGHVPVMILVFCQRMTILPIVCLVFMLMIVNVVAFTNVLLMYFQILELRLRRIFNTSRAAAMMMLMC